MRLCDDECARGQCPGRRTVNFLLLVSLRCLGGRDEQATEDCDIDRESVAQRITLAPFQRADGGNTATRPGGEPSASIGCPLAVGPNWSILCELHPASGTAVELPIMRSGHDSFQFQSVSIRSAAWMQVMHSTRFPTLVNWCVSVGWTTTMSPSAASSCLPSTVNRTGVNDEGFRIGMPVQTRPFSRRNLDEEQRNSRTKVRLFESDRTGSGSG